MRGSGESTASGGRQHADSATSHWLRQACSRKAGLRRGSDWLWYAFSRWCVLSRNSLPFAKDFIASNARIILVEQVGLVPHHWMHRPPPPCAMPLLVRMRAWTLRPNDLSSTNTIAPLEPKFRDFCSRKCSDSAFSLPLLHIAHEPPTEHRSLATPPTSVYVLFLATHHEQGRDQTRTRP